MSKGTTVSYTTTHIPAAVASPVTTLSNAPPGLPAGGQWGRNNYIGEATGAAALVGCLCFCLPGLLILLCPFDERDAYMYEGRVYDAAGRYLGTAGQTSFVPTRR